MNKYTKKKYNNLISNISSMGNAVVAYSGGVDSSFLLNIAFKVLKKNVTAVLINSDISSVNEIILAKNFLQKSGINHEVINLDLLSKEPFITNPPDRCYWCKKKIFTEIIEFANNHKIEHILEGSNYDDLNDYRPGTKALGELNIKSPLLDAKLTKHEIRLLSKKLNLNTWNKPAAPCLATRIPHGETITKDILKKIDDAETFIRENGISNVRVRVHNNIARIEVPENQIKKIIKNKLSAKIILKFKTIGFQFITIDLEGYKMGSMNIKRS